MSGSGRFTGCGHLRINGSAAQFVEPSIKVCLLEIDNAAGVTLQGSDTVTQELRLTNGLCSLLNFDLRLESGATLTGASATSYVQTSAGPFFGPSLVREVGSTQVLFPIGTQRLQPR
ncbi:MAG: hypothetical protein R3B47_05525 [Bacteroidia bacterium]